MRKQSFLLLHRAFILPEDDSTCPSCHQLRGRHLGVPVTVVAGAVPVPILWGGAVLAPSPTCPAPPPCPLPTAKFPLL